MMRLAVGAMKQRQAPKEKRKAARKPRGTAVIQRLQRALQDFLKRRMRVGGNVNVKIASDLIFLRCQEAISPSEVEVGSMQVGRLLLQEVSERRCREVQPELGRLLYRITDLRLLDMCVVNFFRRREKIYVLAMSDRLR
jgi:Na+-translocating membrane potential-generating system (MpsC)